jgi:hypothetical protein
MHNLCKAYSDLILRLITLEERQLWMISENIAGAGCFDALLLL